MPQHIPIRGVLLILIALLSRESSASPRPAAPVPAGPEWSLGPPVILDTLEPPPGRRAFRWAAPAGFAWTRTGPVLVALRGIKAAPAADFWREERAGHWLKLGTVEGVNWPQVFALGNDVGLVGSVGKDPRGGYGNSILFYRVREGRVAFERTIASPPADGVRLTLTGVNVAGDSIWAFLLLERRGQNGNLLLASRSRDGGRTWPKKPIEIGTTGMDEDASRLAIFRFSGNELGRFVTERKGGPVFFRTRNGGRSWRKEPVRLPDEYSASASRWPLAGVTFGEEIGVAYLAGDPEQRGQGRYFFTRSRDRGRSWQKGVAMTSPLKLDDPSFFISLAAAGDRIAVTYIEATGRWTAGELACRLVLSADGGRSWQPYPLDSDTRGARLVASLSSSPEGKRLLFASAICEGPKGSPRIHIAVQDLSLRRDRR